MHRREFCHRAAAPLILSSGVLGKPGQPGANDRVNIAFIGVGGRATWIIRNEETPGAQVVAVADCNLPRCYDIVKVRPSAEKWAKYQDYRRMFDKEKLDAIFVETTTHARVLIAMHALERGLDVYAEKPISLTVQEGRALVKAARRYNRVVQAGTQQRSMPINLHASKLVREGAIGKIHTVITCNFLPPARWVPKPAEAMPDGLDWDQWCNQTELRPYHSHLHRRWSDWWDYDGGGQSWGVSGWGTHALDQVQCALGTDDTGPVELWPEEPGQTGRVTLRYANGTLLKLQEPKKPGLDQLGAMFMGDSGAIQILRGDYIALPQELRKNAPEVVPNGPGESRYHIENFLQCVRSRKKPNADVEIGHRATTVCQLINICRDLGRRLFWDPVAEKFTGDEEANKMLSRPRRKGFELPQV
jgi:predicted dehydrogenase